MTNKLEDLRLLRSVLGNTKVGHWADPWELVYLLDDIDSEIRSQENINYRLGQIKRLDTQEAYNKIWDF